VRVPGCARRDGITVPECENIPARREMMAWREDRTGRNPINQSTEGISRKILRHLGTTLHFNDFYLRCSLMHLPLFHCIPETHNMGGDAGHFLFVGVG
jgi:hypothetical protein